MKHGVDVSRRRRRRDGGVPAAEWSSRRAHGSWAPCASRRGGGRASRSSPCPSPTRRRAPSSPEQRQRKVLPRSQPRSATLTRTTDTSTLLTVTLCSHATKAHTSAKLSWRQSQRQCPHSHRIQGAVAVMVGSVPRRIVPKLLQFHRLFIFNNQWNWCNLGTTLPLVQRPPWFFTFSRRLFQTKNSV